MTREAVESTTRAIISKYDPQRIILFGSAVKSGYREGSDLDLLIIKDTAKKPLERTREVIDCLPHKVDTDIIVLTPAEFLERKRENHYFLREILEKGKVVYKKREVE